MTHDPVALIKTAGWVLALGLGVLVAGLVLDQIKAQIR